MSPSGSQKIILLGHCPDQVGLVMRISGFFSQESVNITRLEQHTERGHFFMRVEGERDDMPDPEAWRGLFEPLAAEFGMQFSFHRGGEKLRAAMLCSKTLHCPLEILSRAVSGDLPVQIESIISNHRDMEPIAAKFGIPFHHTPAAKGSYAHEKRHLELMAGQVDLVILARYMRILSGPFLEAVATPVINIHHAFLPSFTGADPYRQAFERGVKLIGATAHFVTEALDQGPIIGQNVIPVSHAFSIEELKKVGADVEKRELAQAVLKFAERKIIEHNGRTIVFH